MGTSGYKFSKKRLKIVTVIRNEKLQNFLGVISKVISIIAFASKEGNKLFSIVFFYEFVSETPTSEWNDII